MSRVTDGGQAEGLWPSQAFAAQLDAIGVVDDAIENGVCQSGISDHLLAMLRLEPLGATQGGVAGDPHGADR